MTNTADGFLTPTQLIRVNARSMHGDIPAPYGEGDVFGYLKVVQQWYMESGPVELTSEQALEKAVNDYCLAPTEDLVAAFQRFEDIELYKVTKQLVEFMHMDPEKVQEAFDAIRDGWTPESDNETN